jgi:hypothetical protein
MRLGAEKRPPMIKRPVSEGRIIGTGAPKDFKVYLERAKPRRGSGRCATQEMRHERWGSRRYAYGQKHTSKPQDNKRRHDPEVFDDTLIADVIPIIFLTVNHAAVHLHNHGMETPSKCGRQARPGSYVEQEPGENACLRKLCSLMLRNPRVGEHPAPKASQIISEHRLLKGKLGPHRGAYRRPSAKMLIHRNGREREVRRTSGPTRQRAIQGQVNAPPGLDCTLAMPLEYNRSLGTARPEGEPVAMKDVSGALSSNYDCVCQALGRRGDGDHAIVDVKDMRDQLASFISAPAVAQGGLTAPGWKRRTDPPTRQFVSKGAGDSACSRHENNVSKRHPSLRATGSAQDAGQTLGGRPSEPVQSSGHLENVLGQAGAPPKGIVCYFGADLANFSQAETSRRECSQPLLVAAIHR